MEPLLSTMKTYSIWLYLRY